MESEFFNINKVNNKRFTVRTTYSNYLIIVDEVKGIGIYLEYEDGNTLIKSYSHCKIETAINYLLKKTIFLK